MEGREYLLKAVDDIAWLFADNVVRMAVSLFVGVWIARYLGPIQFGQLNYAMALVGIFGVIGALAVDSNVVRDIVGETTATKEILGTTAFLKIAGGLIATTLCIGTVTLLRPDDMVIRWLVVILSMGLVFQAAETIALWFQAQVQSKYVVWAKNSAVFVMAAVKVTLILNNAPLIAFDWAAVADNISKNCGDNAIDLDGGCKDVTVSGNVVIDPSNAGISVNNTTGTAPSTYDIAITGCTIKNVASSPCIYVGTLNGGTIDRVAITGCVTNGGNWALQIEGDSITINGNFSTGSSVGWISDLGGSRRIITGNIGLNTVRGYNNAAAVAGLILAGNKIYSFSSDFIYAENVCLSGIISGNMLNTVSAVLGLHTAGPMTGDLVVQGNFVKGHDMFFYGSQADWSSARVDITYKVSGTAAPTAGTWSQGYVVYNTGATGAGSPGWVCSLSGTFSAYASTCNTTIGSPTVTGVASTSGVEVGNYVSIAAGFATTGPFRVIAKTLTTLKVDTNAYGNQVGTAITTPDPVLKTMAVLAA